MSKTRYLKIETKNAWEYFTIESGSNNRQWAKRYRDMLAKYEMLKGLPRMKGRKDFLDGYKECLNTFHERDNLIQELRDE